MKINIPNLVATVLLLFVFAAFLPVINIAVSMMAGNFGRFEILLAGSIPLLVLLAVMNNLLDNEEASRNM